MLEFQVINVQIHVHETEALNKFGSLSRQILVRTYGPVFTKIHPEFAKVIQRKSTKRVTNFQKILRTPSEHVGAKRLKDQKLDVMF